MYIPIAVFLYYEHHDIERPDHVVLAPPSVTKVTCPSSVVYTSRRAAFPVREEHAIRGEVQNVRVRLEYVLSFVSCYRPILFRVLYLIHVSPLSPLSVSPANRPAGTTSTPLKPPLASSAGGSRMRRDLFTASTTTTTPLAVSHLAHAHSDAMDDPEMYRLEVRTHGPPAAAFAPTRPREGSFFLGEGGGSSSFLGFFSLFFGGGGGIANRVWRFVFVD